MFSPVRLNSHRCRRAAIHMENGWRTPGSGPVAGQSGPPAEATPADCRHLSSPVWWPWPSRRRGGVSPARGRARSALLLTSTSCPPRLKPHSRGALVRLLLDTNALLWWLADEGLTVQTQDAIADPETLSSYRL